MSDTDTMNASLPDDPSLREIMDRFADRLEEIEFRWRTGDCEVTTVLRVAPPEDAS